MELQAHGFGGVHDLPIPLWVAIGGAVAALIVSFAILAVTARLSAEEPTAGGRTLSRVGRLVDSLGWAAVWRVLGLLIAAFTVYCAVGAQDLANNPLFGLFYVVLWIGVPLASLFFGQVWRAISPVRTLAALLFAARGTSEGVFRYPARLGMWPATIGLVAFTWMELIYPKNTYQGPVATWLAVYAVSMVLGSQLWGSTFLENCDPFEVFSSLMAKLSPWARVQGRLVLRRPLDNLDAAPVRPGQVAVLAVLFGTIVYDSFHDALPWLKFTQMSGWSEAHPGWVIWVNDAALIGFPIVVGAFFVAGTMCTGTGDVRRRDLPGVLAPSLIPIVAGYLIAHYASYLWVAAQLTLVHMSDPNSDGANWFGTADMPVNLWLVQHATTLAVLKVLAVVIGHVVGVISAHRRALRVLPQEHILTGQLPLLVTMIGFTAGGLYLLFST